MERFLGYIRLWTILLLDFWLVYWLSENMYFAGVILVTLVIYVSFGGAFTRRREDAISLTQLSRYDQNRITMAMEQLLTELEDLEEWIPEHINISILRWDSSLYSKTYGAGWICISGGTLEHANLDTLKAILAKEIRRDMRMDAEVARAMIGTAGLLTALLSIPLFALTLLVIPILLLAEEKEENHDSKTGIWTSVGSFLLYTHKFFLVLFSLPYNHLSNLSEYRSDAFVAYLGYGDALKQYLLHADHRYSHSIYGNRRLFEHLTPYGKRIARLGI